MKGDKLLIGPEHTARAEDLCNLLGSELGERVVITVAGESGAGKSELGRELSRLLTARGVASAVIQQDDYFVFPPRTNHEMRRRNIEQVGLYEVKLGLLDSNLRSFKRGENPVFKPVVDYDADAIGWAEVDFSAYQAVIVEGTYTTTLRFADHRVFIDRTYQQTRAHRVARARDPDEPFMLEVLSREHQIIAAHRSLADFIVDGELASVERTSAMSA